MHSSGSSSPTRTAAGGGGVAAAAAAAAAAPAPQAQSCGQPSFTSRQPTTACPATACGACSHSSATAARSCGAIGNVPMPIRAPGLEGRVFQATLTCFPVMTRTMLVRWWCWVLAALLVLQSPRCCSRRHAAAAVRLGGGP